MTNTTLYYTHIDRSPKQLEVGDETHLGTIKKGRRLNERESKSKNLAQFEFVTTDGRTLTDKDFPALITFKRPRTIS